MSQFLWLAAGVLLLAASGMVHGTLDRTSQDFQLTPPGDNVAQKYPAMALLEIAPGGLRAPIVNYLWIRSQDLKEQGRYFDAMQLADMICMLQPRFAGVWDFQAWNMAWNISVATHTPEERWKWVYQGVKLLRDKGIPLNPKSLMLYRQLGWIYLSKMGGEMDEMHMSYKQHWAAIMQHLLGAPPGGLTVDDIAAFAPIAAAPLDKDPRRQGTALFQDDQRALLLRDKDVADYARKLGAFTTVVQDSVYETCEIAPGDEQRRPRTIGIDETLLDAYNRYSNDAAVTVSRFVPPRLSGDTKPLYDLINDPDYAGPRGKMLAFVRAQVLWNVYKMDPAYMVALMGKYGPLDWRHTLATGLYWESYGLDQCQGAERDQFDKLQTDRMVLNCLKGLFHWGRITYTENPNGEYHMYPLISFNADGRFIEPTHEQHLEFIAEAQATLAEDFPENTFRDGHRNFLVEAMEYLCARRQTAEAQKWFDWIKVNYNMTGGEWDYPSVSDFVMYSIRQETFVSLSLFQTQWTGAVETAFVLAAIGDDAGSQDSLKYFAKLFDTYQAGSPQRLKMKIDRAELAGPILAQILVEPRSRGYNLTLVQRSLLYRTMLAAWPDVVLNVYDMINPQTNSPNEVPYLAGMCKLQGLDFNKAFPAPPGLEQFRQEHEQRMSTSRPERTSSSVN